MIGFVGREGELRQMEYVYGREDLQTLAIYGRRRVGKTALIKRFCEGRPSLIMMAPGDSPESTMRAFSDAINRFTGRDDRPPGDVRELVEMLSELRADERLVIVIDEFPRLQEVFPGADGDIQWYVDYLLPKQNALFLVCGSSISGMARMLNDGDRPLFERFPVQMRIEPLPYADARLFHPELPEEDRVRMYAICSGMPLCHRVMSGTPVREAVERHLLSDYGLLAREALGALSLEVRPWSDHSRLLANMGGGAASVRELASKSGLSPSQCFSMLKNLEFLGVVTYELPFGMKRGGRYRIMDGCIRFHCDILGRNEDRLVSEDPSVAYEMLEESIASFYGPAFERVCRQYVADRFRCERVGSWWGTVPMRGPDGRPETCETPDGRRVRTEDVDVDIVALVRDGPHTDLLLGECKFTRRRCGVRELEELVARGESVRKGGHNKRYILFSRSGFTEELEEYLEEHPGIRADLVTMDGIAAWAEGPDG